ncbi:hypothetical protein UZ36_06650 [Candidatus Nitromaritima sp. SCGC AAA799-C22]|nr:hypothetical protein UZ36_06650 [Candidatus Nitromaritima sp. SCGC AAA799-C22]
MVEQLHRKRKENHAADFDKGNLRPKRMGKAFLETLWDITQGWTPADKTELRSRFKQHYKT